MDQILQYVIGGLVLLVGLILGKGKIDAAMFKRGFNKLMKKGRKELDEAANDATTANQETAQAIEKAKEVVEETTQNDNQLTESAQEEVEDLDHESELQKQKVEMVEKLPESDVQQQMEDELVAELLRQERENNS